MQLAYVLDDISVEHRPPGYHLERPERFEAVRDALRAAGLARRGTEIATRRATEEELGLVHSDDYLRLLRQRVAGRSGWLDPDTYFSPRSYDAALSAAGAAVDVTAAVLSGEARGGLVVARPPGHHAERDRAMGFCLLNNVAVAAAVARGAGAGRIAIADWDVHHGNGTQQAFYGDPDVLYVSCHQYPYFPGTGPPREVGAGDGVGANVNVALPAGCGDNDYEVVFDEVLLPEIRRFAPELIISSVGFDAFIDDPLAGMNVTSAGYRRLAGRLGNLAEEVCGGRLVCVLEGGYHLGGLADGMVAVLDVLDPEASAGAGEPEIRSPRLPAAAPSTAVRAAIDATKSALRAARGGA